MEILLPCRGLLFDIDGTLVDSIPAVDRAWRTFAGLHGLDADWVVTQIHGRRSIDSIRLLLPDVDAEAENLVIRRLETTQNEGVSAMPGAVELLARLPPGSWGVVTSGTRDVAEARLSAAGLELPNASVCGGDVSHGKPAPDPYLLGAKLLGMPPGQCVGFEDAWPGIRSIQAAGMAAIGFRMRDFRPSLETFDSLTIRLGPDGLEAIAIPRWPG